MKARSRNSNRITWLLPLALLLGSHGAEAQRYTAAEVVYIPAPMYGYVYPGASAAPCYPYCAVVVRNRTLERRQQRFDALRADTPAAAASFGPIAAAKPRSQQGSDEELLPAYRSAGKVRPEYDSSGKYTSAYAEPEVSTAPAAEASPGAASATPAAPEVTQPKRRAQPMLPCPSAAREC